jgi:hypothetical protein
MAIAPQTASDARATLSLAKPGLSDAQYLVMLAHAYFESRWGRGSWMQGTNNWGSMQNTPGWNAKHAADPGYGWMAYTDSHNSGSTYKAGLKVLPTQLLGATEFANAVQAYAGRGSQIADTAAAYAQMLHPMACGKPGGWYEGTGSNCVGDYANALSSVMPQVQAALTSADASGLVGRSDLVRAEPILVDPKHVVTWFVGDSTGGDGVSLGGAVCALALGALAWKALT